MKNRKKLLVFNSATGVIQLVLTAALIFICIPIFINKLGDVQYGVFCAISVVGNLSLFANLALDVTLIKFISEQGKSQESDYDIVITLLLFFILLAPLSIIVFYFKDFILLSILKVPSEYLSVSCILLGYSLIANFLLLIGKTFVSILDASNKIYLTNLYMFIYMVVYWGGIIFVVSKGHGLDWVGYVVCTSAFIWFILVILSAIKTWGKIHTAGLKQNFKRIAKKQISYSSKIYAASLLNFSYEPLTKILISNFIGISYTGVYDIALKIKSNLLLLFSRLLYPTYLLIAQESNYDKTKELIEKLTKGLYYAIIPVIVILFVCTKLILILWIKGNNIEILTTSTIILASLSLLLSITLMPFYSFIRVKNHPEKEIYIQSVNVIANLLVISFTYSHLGFYSVILGNSASLVFSYLLCTYYQKKYLHFYTFSSLKEILKYIGIFALIGAATWLFSLIFKYPSWIEIIFTSLFSCILSAGLFYFLKPFAYMEEIVKIKLRKNNNC